MIVYIFWHRPRPRTERARYEALLAGFHQALAASPPAGFRGSSCHRLAKLPWLGEGPGYEDRYFLTGSEGLDPLDAAAVDVVRRSLHDSAAELASTGAGGLYRRLREGRSEEGRAGEAWWLEKPPDVPYAEFLPRLEEWAPAGVQIWQRQMVLGPAPEFCLVGSAASLPPGRVPGEASVVRLTRTPVWPPVSPEAAG
ncbi:MAG: hypothetical protein ACE5HP_06570 [Gemmatimonadota bacterium]